jgi:hypothetical protein
MKIDKFTPAGKKALLDLVVLSMYLDKHLASVEDKRIQALLGAIGFENAYDRSREYDAAVTRVRPHAENQEAARTHAKELMANFTDNSQRSFALETLKDLVSADGGVTADENRFLDLIQSELQG